MNRKGFTLIELLGSFALLGLILCIGLYTTRGTLATSLSILTDVSRNEIYAAAETYVIENQTNWINNGEEYTCLTVKNLVDAGFFEEGEVRTYQNDMIRIVREPKTKVINSIRLVDSCN